VWGDEAQLHPRDAVVGDRVMHNNVTGYIIFRQSAQKFSGERAEPPSKPHLPQHAKPDNDTTPTVFIHPISPTPHRKSWLRLGSISIIFVDSVSRRDPSDQSNLLEAICAELFDFSDEHHRERNPHWSI